MKTYLLPILLLSLFACKKESNESPIGEKNSSMPETNCYMAEDYYLSDVDSSNQVFRKYFYESDRLVKITYPQVQSGASNPDSTIFVYGSNNKMVYSMISISGVLDTLEKYSYDNEQRLIEVSFFSNGISNRREKMVYENGSLATLIYESPAFTEEYEVKTENGLIKEIILSSRNEIEFDSSYLRQEMIYDNEANPFYETHIGYFNRLKYFNENNLLQYRLIRNGKLDQTQSVDYSYSYNKFGYPVETTFNASIGTYTTYSDFDCR